MVPLIKIMNNEKDFIELPISFKISKEAIDDLMATAVESGAINYWCDYYDLPDGEERLGEYLFEQISKGGKLIFHEIDFDSDDESEENEHLLDLDKLTVGISLFLQNHNSDFTKKDGVADFDWDGGRC